jgi:methionyl aminopeptidase
VEKDIPLKTTLEVARQKNACRVAGRVLTRLKDEIRQGVSTRDIDEICFDLVQIEGGTPSMKGYRNYPGNACTSVNHVAAHGIPGDYILIQGDIITVDLTVEVDGWHGDSAWTYVVGEASAVTRRLIKAAWLTTTSAIKTARAGIRMGDIGNAISKTARRYGCSVLDSFVGHGIGRDMHEEPMVLNSGEPGTGVPVVPGMVITIEPILSLGSGDVNVLSDGWTVVTKDASMCAQFEHTIAIFSNRTEVLTDTSGLDILNLDFPPFI